MSIYEILELENKYMRTRNPEILKKLEEAEREYRLCKTNKKISTIHKEKKLRSKKLQKLKDHEHN